MASNKFLKKIKYALRWMPDKWYLQLYYIAQFHRFCNFKNPRTFNEKLQWLKLHDRNPEYTKMVDKYEAKKYVASIIGEEYIIPTLGVWDNFDDINFDSLPDQFVLKCTHDSEGLVIVTDKSTFDIQAARKKITHALRQNFYYIGREWPYKNVKPRIIAEKYMVEESGFELKDYKVFNFDGKAKIIQVDYGRFSEHMRNLYTTGWEYIEAAIQYPTDPNHQIPRPEKLTEMIDLAEKLSQGFPQLGTDFYSIDDKLYFGELTFYHGSGFESFNPEEFGLTMGEWIKIPDRGYLLKDNNLYIWIHAKPSSNASRYALIDYKFFCFNGLPKFTLVCSDRFSRDGLKETFYDNSWEIMELRRPRCPTSSSPIMPPKNLKLMQGLSEKLAQGISFLRVDFYEICGKVYFGELTFYPATGMEKFEPEEWDKVFGDRLILTTTK